MGRIVLKEPTLTKANQRVVQIKKNSLKYVISKIPRFVLLCRVLKVKLSALMFNPSFGISWNVAS